ncbi:HdeD family acid-resistance protein [Halosimplex litoreum]|uniref:HdeD family acid-resistance protein n=1 Tax=Halosimplex litoreum TaxID=1198301 RepID=A0A7T3G0T3_9EURY|nr:HdeD family acid-resistance protein [Halosimplex litoreum]QPV64132.1 HdeD family acid-resistance protein [Halosimplex litoreum]
MSTDTSSVVSADTQRSWRYLLGAGVLITVLGLIAIAAPFVTGVAVSVLLGALLVVGALGHAVNAFSAGGVAGTVWQVALAAIYAVAGISLLANPVLGLTTVTILLIVYFAVEGLVEVAMGVGTRSDPNWPWYVVSGTVSVGLAVLLWAGFPSTAAWAVGLLTGVHLLSTGLLLAYVGYTGRRNVAASGEATGEARAG